MSIDRLDAPAVDLTAPEPCAECGFPACPLGPEEAAAALRALPQRWRATLTLDRGRRPAGTGRDQLEVLLAGRAPGGWSALEHAGHVRDVLHALDIRIQRVLREDRPVLPGTHVTPPAGANEQGMAVVLAALAVSAEQLARTIETATASSWSRSGLRAGRRVSALELVHEAVHAGSHHLGQAQRAIEAVRESAPSAQP